MKCWKKRGLVWLACATFSCSLVGQEPYVKENSSLEPGSIPPGGALEALLAELSSPPKPKELLKIEPNPIPAVRRIINANTFPAQVPAGKRYRNSVKLTAVPSSDLSSVKTYTWSVSPAVGGFYENDPGIGVDSSTLKPDDPATPTTYFLIPNLNELNKANGGRKLTITVKADLNPKGSAEAATMMEVRMPSWLQVIRYVPEDYLCFWDPLPQNKDWVEFSVGTEKVPAAFEYRILDQYSEPMSPDASFLYVREGFDPMPSARAAFVEEKWWAWLWCCLDEMVCSLVNKAQDTDTIWDEQFLSFDGPPKDGTIEIDGKQYELLSGAKLMDAYDAHLNAPSKIFEMNQYWYVQDFKFSQERVRIDFLEKMTPKGTRIYCVPGELKVGDKIPTFQ